MRFRTVRGRKNHNAMKPWPDKASALRPSVRKGKNFCCVCCFSGVPACADFGLPGFLFPKKCKFVNLHRYGRRGMEKARGRNGSGKGEKSDATDNLVERLGSG